MQGAPLVTGAVDVPAFDEEALVIDCQQYCLEHLSGRLYDLEPEERAEIPQTPGSLDEVLDALNRDHEYLLRGNVFTKDVIDTWIQYKREKEADAIRLRPHPYEFCLYYDI